MTLSSVGSAAIFLQRLMQSPSVEEFWAVALNSRCEALDARMIFRGTVDECQVHPREVFRFALLQNASGLLVGHNHPSQECEPSEADLRLTQRLVHVGRIIQIPIYDHLIVTENHYFSFAYNRWPKLSNKRPLISLSFEAVGNGRSER
ncbi:MAG: JAB domain-containing protein [Oligoflexia bacterium]|nr:JAB domain-containing protein [Oligoflexia bacterium]